MKYGGRDLGLLRKTGCLWNMSGYMVKEDGTPWLGLQVTFRSFLKTSFWVLILETDLFMAFLLRIEEKWEELQTEMGKLSKAGLEERTDNPT